MLYSIVVCCFPINFFATHSIVCLLSTYNRKDWKKPKKLGFCHSYYFFRHYNAKLLFSYNLWPGKYHSIVCFNLNSTQVEKSRFKENAKKFCFFTETNFNHVLYSNPHV